MTARQRKFHEEVLAVREELIRLAADLPLGHVVVVSLPAKFRTRGNSMCLDFMRRVMLLREADMVRYRDAAMYYGKGVHEPRWRTLGRI